MRIGRGRRHRSVVAGLAGLVALCAGCSRLTYRYWADGDAYRIERERMNDPRWAIPPRLEEADARSRMRDVTDPDATPIPPDDPAARPFQVSGHYGHEFHGWKRRGTTEIEDATWFRLLLKEPDGSVLLDRESVMRIAVINARDYQTSVEDLYLTALAVALSRFQFSAQWFGGQNTIFQHLGTNRTDSNQLQLSTLDGFSKQFVTGGQLLVEFANTLVFEFHGRGFNTSTSSLLVNLTQPLLRGAFARIRTQPLSLQERAMLYQIRDFAHFRRSFYVRNVAGNYLNLLTSLQGIRNLETNLGSLRRSLDEHVELAASGLISTVTKDSVSLTYQSSQLSLVQSVASLQTSLDQFKVQLGLPPDLKVKLDDSLLKIFELSDPRLDGLRGRNESLYLSLLQSRESPPRAEIEAACRALLVQFAELDDVLKGAVDELRRWRKLLDDQADRPGSDADTMKRQTTLADSLKPVLDAVRLEIPENVRATETILAEIDKTPPAKTLEALRDLVGKEFRSRLADIFTAQTQARVFLIELPAVDLTLDDAIAVAFGNRVDLMNDQARVTDAWRNVEVAANNLKGGLNLTYSGNLGTDPKHDGIFRFDASNSTQRVGVQFDAPLNRFAERNVYRGQQIAYQRARRQYMATHDQILLDVRLDVRNLTLSRRQFEIGRDRLITAARQVEQAEYNLRTGGEIGGPGGGGQSLTLYLLQAIQGLLDARNGLIQSWVGYQTARMSLFRDLDIMDINAQGSWTNEYDDTSGYRRCPPGAYPGAPVDEIGSAAPAAP